MEVAADLSPERREKVAHPVSDRATFPVRSARWHVSGILAAIALCLVLTPFICAQQDPRAVRAAYVFNLAKYVTWPREKSRLTIGVIGPGGMGLVLKQVLEGKSIDGKKIAVVLRPSQEDIRNCDIVYLTELSPTETRSVLRELAGRPILTVGEGDEFARMGGMIGLARSGDQIQIYVNLIVLGAGRLEISSRLLRLAVIISGKERSR